VSMTTQRRPQTLAALISSGELAGFRPGQPAELLSGINDIDPEVCAASRCELCGQRGLTLRPFTLWRDRRTGAWSEYRTFAECPMCAHVSEF